jgi:two-component system sensor histidine kinase YcbA
MRWPTWLREVHAWWQGLVVGRVWVQVGLWAMGVALLGELKLQLYANSPFRLTLGPVGLGVALLFFPYLPALRTGAAAGAAIVLLRTVLALVSGDHFAAGDWVEAIPSAAANYWPAGVYYLAYSLLFALLRLREHAQTRPVLLFGGIALVDSLSNVLELTLRPDPVTWFAIQAFLLVGLGRASVLTGLYLAMKSQEKEWRHAQERAEYRRLLLFVTGLQAEIFFLRKSSSEMEHIMVRAYTLHRRLKGDPELAPAALEVAKDVHELKKDYQRILSGLQRLTKSQTLQPTMAIADVVTLVLETNRVHASDLGKAIQFERRVTNDFVTADYLLWVSVLNNLVLNAVEACGEVGSVSVEVARQGDRCVVRVTDSATGVPKADWELIFSPGYSTKSDPVTGEFSTGLGLAHAAGLIASLGGEIAVERSGSDGTTFRISSPL